MIFDCPACGKRLRIKDEFAGKKAKCPQCKKTVVVPSEFEERVNELQKPIERGQLGEEPVNHGVSHRFLAGIGMCVAGAIVFAIGILVNVMLDIAAREHGGKISEKALRVCIGVMLLGGMLFCSGFGILWRTLGQRAKKIILIVAVVLSSALLLIALSTLFWSS